RACPNIVIHEQTEIDAVYGNRHIEEIELKNSADKSRTRIGCKAVFVFIGAEPAADWLPREIARDKNGYLLTGTDVVRSGLWPRADRDPCPLETTLPGVLAAGDVRSGSTKRVGFAVGDGSLSVTCAHRLLSIDRRVGTMQWTVGSRQKTELIHSILSLTMNAALQSPSTVPPNTVPPNVATAQIGTEQTLSGRAISPGLAMGRAWVIGDLLLSTGAPESVDEHEIEAELTRLSNSLEETLAELDRYARRIEEEFDSKLSGVFRAHGDILRGLFSSGEFDRELRSGHLTAEAAVRRVLKRWYKKFEALENETFRQRADDVLDLGRNIIRRLRGQHDEGLKSIPPGSILVTQRLLPSDVVRLPKANVLAVIVESLGQGSHAALLAREKGIPTITDLPGVVGRITPGEELLVDGSRGTLVIAPRDVTRAEFQQRLNTWQASQVRCQSSCHDPARTLDGQPIAVQANIGIQDDVALALDNGADGVGLLRIEQLYFARPTPPTEDELYTELKSLVTSLGERTVTIRLLDIGGDKPLPYLGLPAAPNPVLGRRGVRLLLDFSQLVRTQICAILKLSREHSVRVLIPMVTLEDDIRIMRETFDALSSEIKIKSPPQFGAMIETPAAALVVPALLKHVDFFSVGTNDLTQYTLA
ncbi:MAG TPA: putative PEP-binding protein, partial [Pirellulales bacterium]